VIQNALEHNRVWYTGDTVDDARSAKAAGVPFIGIASPAALRRDELIALFEGEGAQAIIPDINEIEAVIR
jgi:phosphoglycolate phosphatase-like HAD superfamily hydrolase